MVLCQYWAEKRRNLLVICPASLRKQWALEFSEKFNLETIILDAKSYKEYRKAGSLNPFRNNAIIICSMHYAGRKADEIKEIAWDLVVIDEAHKLRNVYRKSNKIGRRIRWATEDCKKLLLTATPLQNSLLELYGLSTLIDERLFGDLPSFRSQYINYGGNLEELRERLQKFCWRTLRRQVLEYIQFTERKLITRPFKPTEQEHKFYQALSSYLKRENNYAIPVSQKHLLILVVRKVLASSPRAVAGTLEIMHKRLISLRENYKKTAKVSEQLFFNGEIDEDLLDEILEDEEDLSIESQETEEEEEKKEKDEKIDLEKLNAEMKELEDYIRWARSIGVDTKSHALLKGLAIGFKRMSEMGAQQKAVIFTESRRTQDYLKEFLEANGYAGDVLTFNGSNRTSDAIAIYNAWLEKNQNTGRVTGSRAINIRTALIDYFKDKGKIMIATEAGAEGINLQFCSLVINYDLPWNPQRIEQRIGRCHRYGQKHDVVVINFLNERNEADRRVYELLEQKFKLFTGVFGASDEVLGSIESGVDFERRILDIYQECRTSEEIHEAFEKLQAELDEKIQTKMRETRRKLLDHFDEDVQERLKVNLTGAQKRLDRIGRMFWALTHHELQHLAEFDDQVYTFFLKDTPVQEAPTGYYRLISKERENISGIYLYRLRHPLGEFVLSQARSRECKPAHIAFDITHHPTHIAIIENLKGQSGWLRLEHLRIDSFDKEEYLLFSAFNDLGVALDQETCEKLFNCDGRVLGDITLPKSISDRLNAEVDRHVKATISMSLERNNKYFNEAREQLEKWADDMILAAEKELKDTKEQIKALTRQARQATTIQEQHELQEKIRQLEKKKRRQRQHIFDVEDEIMEKRDNLIDALEKRMRQRTSSEQLFTIRWEVV